MRPIIILTALTASLPLSAQGHLDPAAQLLVQQSSRQAPQRDGEGQLDYRSVYVWLDETVPSAEALSELNACMVTRVEDMATVRIPVTRIAELAALPGIRYVQAPAAASLQLDLARREALADEARKLVTPQGSSYTGRGIVIGVVDAGLDYRHNAFRDKEGKLRIARVWEQDTSLASASAPEGYGYGAEFATPEDILKAEGDTDAGSHGTHVLGIAAGSDPWLGGQYQGVAPEAELVLVTIGETGADNVCVSDAIRYIYDYADAVGKPCVINLSLGSHAGPHDGTSAFDRMADAVQGPGRLIVGAAGNYGEDHFHLSTAAHRATLDDGTMAPLQTLLTFTRLNTQGLPTYSLTPHTAGGQLEVWADATKPLTIELFAYNTFTKKESDTYTYRFEGGETEPQRVSLGRYVTGTLNVASEVNPVNGKAHVIISSELTNIRINYGVGLRVWAEDADIWADNTNINFNAYTYEGFVNPTTESTVTEIGGTAHRILTVGAYTTRDVFRMEGDDTEYPVTGQTLADLCTFSGYGPTADGRQKPDLCAPGSYIISAVSGNDRTGTLRLASSYQDADGHAQLYGYLHGTSMSTPFVTGTAALLLQACPTLTPEQLYEALTTTSRQDGFTTDARYWGCGKVNVLEALRYCIDLQHQIEGIRDVNEDFRGQITLVGDELRVWMAQKARPGQYIRLYDAAGRLCRSYALSTGVDEQRIGVADLQGGVYMLVAPNFSLKLAL